MNESDFSLLATLSRILLSSEERFKIYISELTNSSSEELKAGVAAMYDLYLKMGDEKTVTKINQLVTIQECHDNPALAEAILALTWSFYLRDTECQKDKK